jgi:nitrogen fixation NifU-like protein
MNNSLYQDLIIDHGRRPRHFGELNNALEQRGYNPLCGDELTLYVILEQDHITAMSFKGCGCAISMASASLMIEGVLGHSIIQSRELFEAFHQALTQEGCENMDKLGKIHALVGVKNYPARVKCATLAWHTLITILNRDSKECI